MKSSTKKFFKWTGIIIGTLLLILIAFGAYVYSIIPPNQGKPIVLNEELFTKPQTPSPMEGKYIYKSATELAAMIRSHEASSEEIVTEFLNNIKNNNYKYNAIVWLRESEALAEAQLADIAVAKGDTLKPLLGVPITIKEHIWVKGSPSTMNAKMFGFTAPRNAAIVEQLKNAGAIILGTTNVPFMLSDYQTQGEVYPTASNPYDTTCTPGGSTGGGAAALAAGFTTLELGSDLGGSVREPAALCGLYGLKSTFNSLNIIDGTSPDTITPYTRFSMACLGPLARTPEDLFLMWNVLKDAKTDNHFMKKIEWKPASDKNVNQYKIAWMDEWPTNNGTVKISADVKQKLNMLIDSLKNNGALIEKKCPDTYNEMAKMFLANFGCMMSENQPWLLRKLIKMDMKKLTTGNADAESFNESMDDASVERWEKVQADTKQLADKWDSFFKQYDFFICPVTYGPAFKKCPQGSPINYNGTTVSYMNYVPYTYIFNPTGLPSLIVPMGLSKEGLPIGLQIVGTHYAEPELLHFAKLLKPLTPGFIRPKG